MVDGQLLSRLGALAMRKRWIVGLAVSRSRRRLTAALVAAEGRGLAARVEVAAHLQARLPREVRRAITRLESGKPRDPAASALVAARLAECQAALLDDFASEVAPVWHRVMAVAVADLGLWRRRRGLSAWLGLCDAARLAELSGMNVIDAFAPRDLAQEGRGRPLSPIPAWMLLHDLQKSRVLVECGTRARLTWLPASRDTSGAARLQTSVLAGGIDQFALAIAEKLSSSPRVDELLLTGRAATQQLATELSAKTPTLRVVSLESLRISPIAFRAATAGILGLLHLDQTPANSTAITGARTPRVLGRLTPGSLANWHRLIQELAAARPNVVTLRSAV
jgi:1,6-anhydro-N-acetylmuramate kinase